MGREEKLKQIYSDIEKVKIQGATSIAKAAVKAYSLDKSERNKKKLLNLRPTEPTLSNALNLMEKLPKREILLHFEKAQKKINENVIKILKNKRVIYTHCHSTNVSKALISAKKKGRRFEVVNTETRPLFQGRKTAREMSSSGIKTTTFIDSAMDKAIQKSDIVLLGADAILKEGVINKIGSSAIAKLAKINRKPLYIVADSWKFSPHNVKIEERDFHEVWKKAPGRIKVRNPAFELIPKKYIKGIISEYGILKYGDFLKKARKLI